jgi:hypothetical protein
MNINPVGWFVEGGYLYSDIVSARWRAEKQGSLSPQALFTQQQLDIAVAKAVAEERECRRSDDEMTLQAKKRGDIVIL